MAAWLSISLEGLPMVAAICGVLALRWLREPEDKAVVRQRACSASPEAASLLFVATRGLGDLANHCDAISPVHLAVLGWAAIGACGLVAARPALAAGAHRRPGGHRRRAVRRSCWRIAPECARGGFAGMDPLVESFWYRGIAEGQPLWQQPVGHVLQALVPPLLGLTGVYALWRGAGGRPARALWLDYALLLGAALAVALFVTRAGSGRGSLRRGAVRLAPPALAGPAAERRGRR